MSWGFYRPYVSVAKRREQANKQVEKLKKKGKQIHPVNILGRKIVTTFWGKAWCDHLESLGDFANRLPRGRTYVRNGSVCHLEIFNGHVEAIVAGSSLYNVKITINQIADNKWLAIKKSCSGKISSILDLLAGKLSDGVMSIVCNQDNGLLPIAKEIKMSCDCPDWATMCKHVAAVLYGVGARLDTEPAELFKLRNINYEELIDVKQALEDITSSQDGKSRRLSTTDVTNIFEIDLIDIIDGGDLAVTHKTNTVALPDHITGNMLSKKRKSLGLTKAELSKKIELSVTTISKWESSGNKKISAKQSSIDKILKLW